MMGRNRNAGKPGAQRPGKTLKRIFAEILSRYKFHCLAVVLCLVVSAVANVRGTLFMQTLIDDYITPMMGQENPDFGPLAGAILGIAVVYVLGAFSSWLYNYLMIFVSQGTLKNLRIKLFDKMERLPIRYFDTHKHGDVMSVYTNDIDTMRQMISQSMPQLISSVITIVSIVTSMIILNVPLMIITLAMVALTLRISVTRIKSAGRFFVKQQMDLGKVNGYIEEMMDGQKVVKVFCHEEKSIEEFSALNEALRQSSFNANRISNTIMPVTMAMGNLSYVLCAVVGGLLATQGYLGLTIGTLVSFLTLNKSFNQPINQVSQQSNSIIMALAGAERVFALLDEEPEVDDGYVTLVNVRREADGTLTECPERTHIWAWKHPHKATGETEYVELKGDIVMDNVDFGYTDDKIVLHDIKLYATPGQKIAFVGSTGAGKTTITNLINRFYDIQDGKIRYDGININKIKKDDLRRSLGIVLQDTHLFTGTVMENIRLGRRGASDAEVMAAARAANCEEFVSKLPQGYQTPIGENGAKLSGGERQRISIARALLKDAPIVLLDEATASLDVENETKVQGALSRLLAGKTVLVIAHRMRTVAGADHIVALKDGKVAQQGSPQELMAESGLFRHMVELQNQSARWQLG